jgi:hypothetical protein
MTPRARKAAAEKLMARWEMSQRRAARLVGCDPKTLRREPDRRDDYIRNGCVITRPSGGGSATGVSG